MTTNRVIAAYERHKPVKSYLIDWYAELLDKLLDPESVQQLVEFGVLPQSARFWHELYPKARIIAVDQAKNHTPYCEFVHGDYTSPQVVEKVLGRYQLMIDDANHERNYQMKGLELYWPMLDIGGLYIIEDIIGRYTFDALMEMVTKRTSKYVHRWDPKGHGEGGEFVLFITKEKEDDNSTVQNQSS